jgi:hypothetical protein
MKLTEFKKNHYKPNEQLEDTLEIIDLKTKA